ncbi:unnamed protein product [Gadus morhua 'NCC']
MSEERRRKREVYREERERDGVGCDGDRHKQFPQWPSPSQHINPSFPPYSPDTHLLSPPSPTPPFLPVVHSSSLHHSPITLLLCPSPGLYHRFTTHIAPFQTSSCLSLSLCVSLIGINKVPLWCHDRLM